MSDERDERAPIPPPASGPNEGGPVLWINRVIAEYGLYPCCSLQKLEAIIRRHAPAQRYPEVCEFLDAASGPSIISFPNGTWWVSGWINRNVRQSGFHDTLAAACRAALDAKERADGR